MAKTRLDRETEIEKKERELLQKKILERYPDKVAANKAKFCTVCWAKNCFLLPVTIKGEDCPYFSTVSPKQV